VTITWYKIIHTAEPVCWIHVSRLPSLHRTRRTPTHLWRIRPCNIAAAHLSDIPSGGCPESALELADDLGITHDSSGRTDPCNSKSHLR
jgi:hypothetical protein